MNGLWTVENHHASASEIHALGVPESVARTVRVFVPTAPALVLGSTQSESDVDIEAAQSLGVAIVKRRSGGGAVLVEPDDLIWLDVFIPGNDALWSSDVGRAFYWLGDQLASSLHDIGYDGIEMYRGPLVATAWSKKICFAGLGPGECTQSGRKILGISQRRTRDGALFQLSINRHFAAEKLATLLAVPDDAMRDQIMPGIGSLPGLDPDAFMSAFLARIGEL